MIVHNLNFPIFVAIHLLLQLEPVHYLKVSLLTQNGCDVQINNVRWSQLSCMKKKTSLLYIKFNLKQTRNSSLHKRLKSYSPEWIFRLLFLLI